MTEISTYEDPLITLVKDPNLNKERAKAEQLLGIITGFTTGDRIIKRHCINGFQILRDLERIELKSKDWQFLSLDFQISNDPEQIINETDEIKNKFNRDLATNVLDTCLDMRRVLYNLNDETDRLNGFVQKLTTFDLISDPGTILSELLFRIVKLNQKLDHEISITYSKAKLITMGINLKTRLYHSGSLSDSTLENYKNFINDLLSQLNFNLSTNDTIGVMECIDIVSDLEKMFNAMDTSAKKIEDAKKEDARKEDARKEDARKEDARKEDAIAERRGSFTSISTSQTLSRTTISEEMPYLLNAFDNLRFLENEIKGVGIPPSTPKQQSDGFLADGGSHIVYPHLPAFPLPSHDYLPRSPLYQSAFLSRLGIRPQVIESDFSYNDIYKKDEKSFHG